MFAPKVSIVIPVYNGANYLREAIDSALGQTYENVEVIIVNDGSDDNGATESIVRSFGGRVSYHAKANGGVATALNTGIALARGDYLSWLSHDDVYYPHKIERQIALLATLPSRDTILYSDYEMIDAAGNLLKTVQLGAASPGNPGQEFFMLLFRASVHGCSLLIPKRCFSDVGCFDEDLRTTQDYDLWFRMLRRGYEFRHMAEILLRSRIHGEQGTHALSAVHHREAENLYVAAVDMFSDDIMQMPLHDIVGLVVELRGRRLKLASRHLLGTIRRHDRPLYRQMYGEYGAALLASRLRMMTARPRQLMEGTINLLRTRVMTGLKGRDRHASSP